MDRSKWKDMPKGWCPECGQIGSHSKDCTQFVFADEVKGKERASTMADRLFDRDEE